MDYRFRRAVFTDAQRRVGKYLRLHDHICCTFTETLVAAVMQGPVITCSPETPIQLVAQTMSDEHIHAIVVTGIEDTAWGVLTALDIAAAAGDGGDRLCRP